MIAESQIFELLQDIEDGSVKLKKGEPDDLHYGNVSYIADRWTLIIFFDCGEWDNIDSIISPSGKTMKYDEFSQELKNYRPPEKVRREIYNSPGYLGCYLGEAQDES